MGNWEYSSYSSVISYRLWYGDCPLTSGNALPSIDGVEWLDFCTSLEASQGLLAAFHPNTEWNNLPEIDIGCPLVRHFTLKASWWRCRCMYIYIYIYVHTYTSSLISSWFTWFRKILNDLWSVITLHQWLRMIFTRPNIILRKICLT